MYTAKSDAVFVESGPTNYVRFESLVDFGDEFES